MKLAHEFVPSRGSPTLNAGATDAPDSNTRLLAVLEQVFVALDDIRGTLAGMHKDWFTVQEVAKFTGRSSYTVRRWITEGRLRATRVSGTGPKGRLLIAQEELRNLIASGAGGGVPEVLAAALPNEKSEGTAALAGGEQG